MATKKKTNQINLVPRSEFESSVFGRILTWLLTTFRYIVIVTEMIVMLAFFSRIWLDAKNADLADELKQKEAVLAATKSFEEDFENDKAKLAILKEKISAEGQAENIFEEVVSLTPANVVLISYSQSEDGIHIRASSPSEEAIAQHLVNLQSSELFNDVSLTSIKTQQDSTFLEYDVAVSNKTKG